MGRLTTHVLDTTHGCPGSDIALQLYQVEGLELRLLSSLRTNADGRCEGALIEGAAFAPGTYQLHVAVGDYFRARGTPAPQPAFLETVVLRFEVADSQQHYHVPLLVSPYGYSTYRGS